MPLPLLEAHIDALPALEAEEAITLAGAVAAGSGRLTDAGRQAWERFTDAARLDARRRQVAAEAVARDGGRRPIPVHRLAGMGVAVVIRPGKGTPADG